MRRAAPAMTFLAILGSSLDVYALAGQTGGPGTTPDSWSETAIQLPDVPGWGGKLLPSGDPDVLYWIRGGGSDFYKFKISTGQWTALAPVPFSVGMNATSTHRPGTNSVYLLEGHVYYDPADRYFSVKPRFVRFDPESSAPGTWQEEPSLPASTNTSMSLAASADSVFALGGQTWGGMQTWVGMWKFAPGSGWSRAAYPSSPNLYTMAYPGSGDQIFATGGSGMQTYSMTDNTWASSPDPAPSGGVTLGSGPSNSLYTLTADGSSDVQLHQYGGSPAQWTQRASTPVNSVPGRLGDGASTAYPGAGNVLYVTPGGNRDLWTYSIDADRFPSVVCPLPGFCPYDGSIVGIGNGDNLFVGGSGGFHRYSRSSDRWTTRSAPSSPPSRDGLIHDGGGFLYFAKGLNSAEIWRYSIADDLWTNSPAEVAPLPESMSFGGRIVNGGGGTIYATIGGDSRRLYRYTPETNAWDLQTNAPGPIRDHAMAYSSAGNRLYVFQGTPVSGPYDPGALWIFSISQNLWNVREDGSEFDPADLPDGVYGSSTFAAHPRGKSLFLLQDAGNGPATWTYSIELDRWTTVAAPPFRSIRSAAFMDEGWFLYAVQADSRHVWRYQIPDAAPDAPRVLGQYRLDGTTPIPPGGTTIEPGFVAAAQQLTDIDGDPVRLQVRVAPTGAPFVIDAIAASSLPLPSGSDGTATVTGLPLSVNQRWEARTIDDRGIASAWTCFGLSDAGETDFITRTNQAPGISSLLQLDPTSGLPVAAGGKIAGDQVTFHATISDMDDDQVRVQVEVILTGASWSGSVTGESAPVGNGGEATLTLSRLATGSHSWRCRAVDAFDIPSAWAEFGGNAGSEADFSILSGGSSNKAGCPLSTTGGGTGLLVGLAVLVLRTRRD